MSKSWMGRMHSLKVPWISIGTVDPSYSGQSWVSFILNVPLSILVTSPISVQYKEKKGKVYLFLNYRVNE